MLVVVEVICMSILFSSVLFFSVRFLLCLIICLVYATKFDEIKDLCILGFRIIPLGIGILCGLLGLRIVRPVPSSVIESVHFCFHTNSFQKSVQR